MYQNSTQYGSRPLPNEPEAYLFGWAVVEFIHDIRVSWDQGGSSPDEVPGLEKLDQDRTNITKIASQLLGEIATADGELTSPFQDLQGALDKAWKLFQAARIFPDLLDIVDTDQSADGGLSFGSDAASPIVVYQVKVVGSDLEAVRLDYELVTCPLFRHADWSEFLRRAVAFCEALPPDLRDMAFLGLALAQMSLGYEIEGEDEYSLGRCRSHEWLISQMKVFWDEYDALGFMDSDELEPPYLSNPIKLRYWSREIDRRLREEWYGSVDDQRLGKHPGDEAATTAGQHPSNVPAEEKVTNQKTSAGYPRLLGPHENRPEEQSAEAEKQTSSGPQQPPEEPPAVPANLFRKQGDDWNIQYAGGKLFSMSDLVGLFYISCLIRNTPDAMTPKELLDVRAAYNLTQVTDAGVKDLQKTLPNCLMVR